MRTPRTLGDSVSTVDGPAPSVVRSNIRIAQTFLPPSTLDIHAVRPHRGQIEVAFRFRSLLDSDHHPSEIAGLDTFGWRGLVGVVCAGETSNVSSVFFPPSYAESHRFCDRVQDAYTLRCCPQVKSRDRRPAKALATNSEGKQ